MDSEELVVISGTIESVLYTNEENGYSVFRPRTADLEDAELITVTGCLPMASPGENVIVTGKWMNHQTYGRQLKAEFAERQMPSSADVIFQFLSGGAIKGIGPALASLIVNRFGDRTLEIIENQPEKLAAIKGISEKKAFEFSEMFHQQMLLRRILEYLCSKNVRPVVAMRLYKFYGENAFDVLNINPYIIASSHVGGRFDEADRIAADMGFSSECPERIGAAAVFELRHNLNNGHCFIPKNSLIQATSQLIGIDLEVIAKCLNELIVSGEIVYDNLDGTEACYLPDLYKAETETAKILAGMALSNGRINADFDEILLKIKSVTKLEYSAEQQNILRLALENRVIAVTGGPGTGKTYSLSAVLEMFDCLGIKTCLAAPTGRAAKRISELTGREAMTIHRLLGAKYSDDGEKIVFSKNSEDKLDCGAVVLDECSMIDIILFHALLSAMPDDARLVLVGDADQLPPVGPGNAFRAIIKSSIIKKVKLNTIFRQAENSLIVENAHKINEGQYPDFGKNRGDFFRLKRIESASSVETVCELCASRLPQKMNIPVESIQVISLSRKGEMGVINLNKELQKVLNPRNESKNEKAFGDVIFREGDRIMQIRNDYDICWHDSDYTVSGVGMFNGDIGYIAKIDNENEYMIADFDGKIVTYGFELLVEIEHSWAITVHKSQGSEFKAVVLALSNQSKMLMTRGVLYTAVTRARDLLILVGNDKDAYYMIDNSRQANRFAFLRTRIDSIALKLS